MSIAKTYHPPELDREKLKVLVHYVCHKAPNPRQLGATKLNKILFYAEMESYVRFGKPIAGERYVKRKFGPVPYHILAILEELNSEEAIAISEEEEYHVFSGDSYPQRMFFPLRRPNLETFSGDEISIVDEFVDMICNKHTAKSISALSHNITWKNAEIGEDIPYYTAFSGLLGEITEDDTNWASKVLGQAGDTA